MIRIKTFIRNLTVMMQPDIKANLEEINERINQAFLRRPPVNFIIKLLLLGL